MKREDTKFLEGAFLLTGAGVVVKLIGALNRIPLFRILGDEGMGLYQMAYPIYTILLTVSSAGLNVAVSKVVAEQWALGKKSEARNAFKVSLAVMALLGLIASLILYGSSEWIARNLAHDGRAVLSIRAISPALIAVGVLSAFRGWFQGIQQMGVPALTQVVEQVGRLLAMLLLANAFLERGLAAASAGATMGASIGALLAMVVAIAFYVKNAGSSRIPPDSSRTWRTARFSRGQVLRRVLSIAAPVSLASAIFGITEIVDLVIVPGRLQAIGFSAGDATRLFGQLAAGAFPLLNLPTIFTAAFQAALVPSISSALALGDREAVRRRTRKTLSLTLALALPVAVGLHVLSNPIPSLLYSQPEVGAILRTLTPAVVFLSLQQVTSGILQGLGNFRVPLLNLSWAIVIKASLTYFLVGYASIGILGAGLATTVYFAVAGLLNLRAVCKEVSSAIDWAIVLKLPLAGTALALLTELSYWRLSSVWPLGMATAGAIVVGAFSYAVACLALAIVTPDDLASLPLLGRFFRRGFRK